jgi:hypothetical protein|tara:strand:- start:7767 stop:8018 length:252 start_codon:yes stop_codon:yes gene_type:complete
MKKSRSVYFDEQTQKVRWTTTSSENFIYDYKYIGEATENEFNILIDLLWYLHEEKKMSYNDFNKVYSELRYFCDRVMGLVDEL